MITRAHRQDFLRRFNGAGRPFGGRITSYWRSAADNQRVGGARRSQHLSGLAIDVVPAPGERQRLKSAMRRAGLIVIDEGDHVHVQRYRADDYLRLLRT